MARAYCALGYGLFRVTGRVMLGVKIEVWDEARVSAGIWARGRTYYCVPLATYYSLLATYYLLLTTVYHLLLTT